MQILALIVARFVIVTLSLAVAGVCPAYAQRAEPRRPASGGLFGATRTDVAGADKLDFMFELATGVESAVPPELASRVSRNLESGGLSTLIQASSDYAHSGRRVGVGGAASTAFKYYQSLDRFDPLGHSAGLGASIRLLNGELQLNQSAAYSPSYFYQLFPVDITPTLGASIPTHPEYQLAETDSYSYATTANFSVGAVGGTQFKASGAFSRTDFDQAHLSQLDLDSSQGGVHLSRRLSTSWRVISAYNFRSSAFGDSRPTTEHGATIGIEFSPALSRTRRATFRLNVTPTRLQLRQSVANGLPAGEVDQHMHRLSSEASVSYPFRLNWRTEARYRRSVEYLSVLGQPVLSDGGRFELSGLLSRRIDLIASAGYVSAASALSPAQSLVTYTGEVAIRYAFKRSLAFSSEYLYYYYDMRQQAALAPHLPPRFEQHAFRVGVVLFVETLGR